MEIFQPNLELVVEPDGEYTLNAVTIAPSSGYSAGRAHPGVPPNIRLFPEAFPVILPIRTRRGRALQVLTPVRHHLRNLKLGAKLAKTSVVAFAMIGDHIVGKSSVLVSSAHHGPKTVTVDTSDWYAWLNKMPPGPPSFHVSGIVHTPTPGYTVSLEPARPQGINPRELILQLNVKALPGIWPQHVAGLSVRYDQSPAGVEYDGVLVREPDGDAAHMDVDVVQ